MNFKSLFKALLFAIIVSAGICVFRYFAYHIPVSMMWKEMLTIAALVASSKIFFDSPLYDWLQDK